MDLDGHDIGDHGNTWDQFDANVASAHGVDNGTLNFGFGQNSPQNQQQQAINRLASSVLLEPERDITPGDDIADRSVNYVLNNNDGSKYKGPSVWVNELIQTVSGGAPGGTVDVGNGQTSSASPANEPNQWNDSLGNKLSTANADYKQTFIITPTPGVHPKVSARINVRIAGQQYGTLAVNIKGRSGVVSINGHTKFPGTKPK